MYSGTNIKLYQNEKVQRGYIVPAQPVVAGAAGFTYTIPQGALDGKCLVIFTMIYRDISGRCVGNVQLTQGSFIPVLGVNTLSGNLLENNNLLGSMVLNSLLMPHPVMAAPLVITTVSPVPAGAVTCDIYHCYLSDNYSLIQQDMPDGLSSGSGAASSNLVTKVDSFGKSVAAGLSSFTHSLFKTTISQKPYSGLEMFFEDVNGNCLENYAVKDPADLVALLGVNTFTDVLAYNMKAKGYGIGLSSYQLTPTYVANLVLTVNKLTPVGCTQYTMYLYYPALISDNGYDKLQYVHK